MLRGTTGIVSSYPVIGLNSSHKLSRIGHTCDFLKDFSKGSYAGSYLIYMFFSSFYLVPGS